MPCSRCSTAKNSTIFLKRAMRAGTRGCVNPHHRTDHHAGLTAPGPCYPISVMDAISPEIRLTLAPGEPKPEPREWRYDVRRQALLHVPTRAIFHVYRVLSRPPGPGVDAPDYDEASMRARL